MLNIRRPNEADLDRLLQIINEPSIIRYMPLEKPVKMDKIVKWYQSSIMFDRPAIFVLERGSIIGACSISEEGKVTVWIDEENQRKGYGIQAIEFLKGYARKNGLSRLWLECFKDNIGALAFYNHLGFSRIGEKGNELIMELKI